MGVASTIASILVPPLAPALWAVNIGISAYTAIQSGSVGGFIGGLVGGAVFGAMGSQIGLGMASAMGPSVLAGGFAGALGGAISGAAEFGLAGFGSGFGSALASGGSVRDSLRAGGYGAAAGAAFGAATPGSYLGGLQGTLHGNSIEHIAGAQGQAALQAGRPQDLAGIGAALRTRTRNQWGLYLHGTDAAGAAGIKDTGLNWKSFVTLPKAVDPATGKIALQLNPAEFSRFVSQPRPGVGDWFVLLTAHSEGVKPMGITQGGAPQFQIYGEHIIEAVYKNPN